MQAAANQVRWVPIGEIVEPWEASAEGTPDGAVVLSQRPDGRYTLVGGLNTLRRMRDAGQLCVDAVTCPAESLEKRVARLLDQLMRGRLHYLDEAEEYRALLAAGILMPIYVQSLHGLSATVSGLVLMPGAILMGIMNPLAGKWFDRHGPRRMAIVGMSLLTLTTFAFAILNLTSSIIYITIVYTVRMFSMSLVNMPITTWGMNALDNKVMNHGTSVNNTLRQVACLLYTSPSPRD